MVNKMRYYLVSQDKGYSKLPKIKNVFDKLSLNRTKAPNIENLEKRFILEIESEVNTEYVEILMSSLFLVTQEIKDCIKLYEPNISCKEVILLDRKNKEKYHYYLPELDSIECLTDNCEYGFGHYELKKIEIDENKTKDKAIFRLAKMEKDYIIMRLDLVESLLRRGARGIMLEEIQVLEREQ